MTPHFWIKSISFNGTDVEQTSVNFKPGLNVVHGPSDTGKTYLAKSINYMLAGATRPFAPEDTGYDEITMEIQYGQHQIRLIRKIGQSKIRIRGANGLGIPSDEYDVVNSENNPTGFTISDLLLKIIGCPENRDVLTSKYGARKKLSWRSFSDVFYRSETRITSESSILDHGKYETLAALGILFFNADYQHVPQVKDPAQRKQERSYLIPYYDFQLNKILNRRKEIKDEVEGVSPDSLARQRDQLEHDLEHLRRTHDELREENTRLTGEIRRCEEELQHHKAIQQRYEELASLYLGNLDRIGMVASAQEAENATTALTTQCPFCDNLLTQEAGENLLEAAKAETEQTIHDLKNLTETQQSNEEKIKHLKQKVTRLKTRQRNLEDDLVQALRPAINDLRQQLHHVQNNESLYAEDKFLEQQYLDLLEFQRKLDEETEPESTFEVKEIYPQHFFDAMTTHIQTILKEVQFEEADRASFSQSHFDVTIGNRPKKVHGKGYRAFFNTVVNLAVRAYIAINTDIQTPVVVIDTPTLGLEYGKSGNSLITKRDESNRPVHGLLRNLFDYMADSANLGQIIILNNTDVTPVVHYNDELNGEVIFGSSAIGMQRQGLLNLDLTGDANARDV